MKRRSRKKAGSGLLDVGETGHVWIDDAKRILSFHKIPNARCYSAPEPEFSRYIQQLIQEHYSAQ